MEVYSEMIALENKRYGPFLATTEILMKAVEKGLGRETAHEVIKEHAVQVVQDLRGGKISQNDFVRRLSNDSRLGFSEEMLSELVSGVQAKTGLAEKQVEHFCTLVRREAERFPEAAKYKPESIL